VEFLPKKCGLKDQNVRRTSDNTEYPHWRKSLAFGTMYRFLIVIEKADGNYSAYSPDLPGCVATGATREEVERNMHEAIEMHVRGLEEDHLPIPESHSFAEYVAVH